VCVWLVSRPTWLPWGGRSNIFGCRRHE